MDESAPAERRLGDYLLRRVVGSGAAGTVWDAWDIILQRRVAVKVVRLAGKSDEERADVHARFRQEAQLTARLQHPGIVGVFRFEETAEEAFLAMEFVDGETLKAPLDRGEALGLDRIVTIMTDVLLILEHCHRDGVVHRDIKPSNIMLPVTGGVKLADFGIARPSNSDMTVVGTLIGTLPYMSPEQFTATAPVDLRTDIWSCGVVLYELLTGQRPFRGDLGALLHQVVNVPHVPPSQAAPHLPPAVNAVVARALAKHPDARFASAKAFADALRALRPSPDPDPTSEPRSRLSYWLLGTALALAGIAALGAAMAVWLPGAIPLVSAPKPEPPAAAPPPPPPPPPRTELPPPVPAPPAPTVVAPETAIATLPCAALRIVPGGADGKNQLRGVVGEGAPQRALDAVISDPPLGSMRRDVRVFPATAANCRLVELVRQINATARSGPTLSLSMVGGREVLGTGEEIHAALRMPDFDAALTIIHIASTGEVTHLGTSFGIPPRGRAGALITGGGSRADLMLGVVGPPYGTDLIIAIASSEPLFDGGGRVPAEANGIADSLAVTAETLGGPGGRASADILVLRTVRR